MDKREITVADPKGAEAAARRWITLGWHRDAKITQAPGTGSDLYGPYISQWYGSTRDGAAVRVIVRAR